MCFLIYVFYVFRPCGGNAGEDWDIPLGELGAIPAM